MKSSTKMPTYSSHINSAVYLNNVGVMLMEQCCYPEVLETFCSALEVCQGTPSQAMVEHTVYHAFLLLSSVTDDGESKELLTMEWATPVIYNQFGNNTSVNLSRKDDCWSVVSPFDWFLQGGDLQCLEYSIIYFQLNHWQGLMEMSSLLLVTILANSCQVHHLIAHLLSLQGQSDICSQHMEMVQQLFLWVQQEVKHVSSSSPVRCPVHMMEEFSLPEKNRNSCIISIITAVTTNTVVQRREPRFRLNPAA